MGLTLYWRPRKRSSRYLEAGFSSDYTKLRDFFGSIIDADAIALFDDPERESPDVGEDVVAELRAIVAKHGPIEFELD